MTELATYRIEPIAFYGVMGGIGGIAGWFVGKRSGNGTIGALLGAGVLLGAGILFRSRQDRIDELERERQDGTGVSPPTYDSGLPTEGLPPECQCPSTPPDPSSPLAVIGSYASHVPWHCGNPCPDGTTPTVRKRHDVSWIAQGFNR